MNSTQATFKRSKHRASRAAFSAAIVSLAVGVFASFGGVGYAASGSVHAVRHLAHNSTVLTAAKDQYSKPKVAPHVAGAVKPSSVTTTHPLKTVKATGTLPFTGFPLALTAAIGLLFIALGAMLRRRETSDL